MTSTMRTRLLAAAATAALLTIDAATLGLAPVSAATNPHPRYVALTGDTDFLVFAEATSSQTINPIDFGGGVNLFALAKTGRPVNLGKAGRQPRLVSLSRSNLVVVNPYLHHYRIRWWNLSTGQHGVLATNENVVGATPNGWLTEDGGYADGTHVIGRSESGGLVDYGNPVTPGVDYAVVSGPNGFVAYADNFLNDNGEITYTSWSHPGRHRTLIPPGGKNVRCDSVSSAYAGCVLGGGARRTVALIALTGNARTTGGNRCAFAVTVWGTELAWNITTTRHSCPKGHIGVMTSDGVTRTSKLRFDPMSVTAAWGRLVTSSQGQRTLVTLTGVRAKPKPLQRAAVA
jgi:hypothetical protein